MYDLKKDQTSYQFETAQEGLALGLSQADIDGAMEAQRLGIIKHECGRRIYGVASAETQMNMAAAAAVISGKTSSSRSDQEKAVLAGVELALNWVGTMRANVATLFGNAEDNPLDDANWPETPAAVQALVDQF